MFDSVTAGPDPAEPAADPLEVYLASPVNPNVSDPLAYWYAMSKTKNPYDAAFARMALDFLSIPGMSGSYYAPTLCLS